MTQKLALGSITILGIGLMLTKWAKKAGIIEQSISKLLDKSGKFRI